MPEGLQAGKKGRAEDRLTSLAKGELTSSRPSVHFLFWGDQVLPGSCKTGDLSLSPGRAVEDQALKILRDRSNAWQQERLCKHRRGQGKKKSKSEEPEGSQTTLPCGGSVGCVGRGSVRGNPAQKLQVLGVCRKR